jgi:hypothetical protein
MTESMRLYLAEDGADPERLDQLTGQVRAELRQFDEISGVSTLPGSPPPPGTRGANIETVGALLVMLGQSAEGLRAVVGVACDWMRRGDGTKRTVRVEIAGDVLELSEATPAEQQRLIDFFVGRHGT